MLARTPKTEMRLPGRTHRTSIYGRTGTGKSVLGMFLLSKQDLKAMPWIIVDYKGDDNLALIQHVKEIGIEEKIPTQAGLYRVQPHPDDADGTDAFLKRVWENEHTGMLWDEAYMLPDRAGLRAVLTQGRSKHIPVISVSQRPVWLSRFVYTQADFHAAFPLNDLKDIQSAQSFMPRGSVTSDIPEHWSRWYDVGHNALYTLKPVPPPDEIADTISKAIKPRRKIF